MIRCLREKIDGAEHFDAYHAALLRGLNGAAGVHFEELLHWCLSQSDYFDGNTSSVRASGKGGKGVRELNATKLYWIPSIPNFVNIDSAILGSDGHLWCFQFTIDTTHSWKRRRLTSSFVNIIPPIGVAIVDITIVFVVPTDIQFKAPDIQNEVNALVVKIDRPSLGSVLGGLEHIFASTVHVK